MAELHIRLEFSRALAHRALVGLLILSCVPELGSETVTLTTYYPAPSGVYTNMITTSNTWLVRDSATNNGYVNIGSASAAGNTSTRLIVMNGRVGVGNSNPAAMLDVTGSGNVTTTMGVGGALTVGGSASIGTSASVGTSLAVGTSLSVGGGAISGTYGLQPNYANWAAYGTGAGGAAIYNSNQGAYQALMLVGNDSGGLARQVKAWDDFSVSRDGYTGAVQVVKQLGCVNTAYNTTGYTACGSGYATTITGVMAKYTMMPLYRDTGGSTTGRMWCCPCPSKGCNVGI